MKMLIGEVIDICKRHMCPHAGIPVRAVIDDPMLNLQILLIKYYQI